jgi:hypothetical protein
VIDRRVLQIWDVLDDAKLYECTFEGSGLVLTGVFGEGVYSIEAFAGGEPINRLFLVQVKAGDRTIRLIRDLIMIDGAKL